MEQNEKGLMQWEKDFLISITILIIATIIAHIFFYQTAHNINVPMIYTLATFFISRYTKGYGWGIVSSLLSVIFINWRFTFPYFKINFMIDGYPMTFLGILVIAIITNMTTTSLNREKEAAVKREKELAKLNEYNKQINELQIEKEKEKMRSNLLRAISHDLRTPLTGMIGASSTYLEAKDQLDEEAKDQLVMGIKEDANWLLNMVENLLSVTRINNETAKVTKTSEPVEEVLSEAVIRLKKRLPDANIHVRVPEEFLMVPMDAVLIEQVLINLLENAVVHAESTEPIECYVESLSDYAIFHVRDYGVGIPPEKLATIFDGSSSTTSTSPDGRKGMGIGLSICKTIILAHGGEIKAINHTRGAEFYFTLPKEDK